MDKCTIDDVKRGLMSLNDEDFRNLIEQCLFERTDGQKEIVYLNVNFTKDINKYSE
jgi:hypothetical protein